MRADVQHERDLPTPDYETTRALILFTTGDAPRSRRARTHLTAALNALGSRDLQVEEIDVIARPSEAVRYRVFATPALMWHVAGSAESVLYGDLSDREALLAFLTQER